MFGLPGDPAAILYTAGGSVGLEEYKHFREKWGLVLPIWKQYTQFITNLLQGDMGTSLVTKTPIFQELKSYFPATIELSVVAFIFACIMGLPLGVISALRRNSWVDHTIRAVSFHILC